MNIKTKAIILVVILFSITFSGCTDFEIISSVPSPRHKMEVIVIPTAKVEIINSTTNQYRPGPNKTVNFQILKTSGKTFTFEKVTDQDGYVECNEVGYNFYEGQVITVYYSTDGVSKSSSLSFETIYDEETGIEQTYLWEPHVILKIYES